jgi:hypothetical protein
MMALKIYRTNKNNEDLPKKKEQLHQCNYSLIFFDGGLFFQLC